MLTESFTSTLCIIFSSLQLASARAKDLYNLMNICIQTTFSAKESICFVSQASSQTHNFLPAKEMFFKLITHKPVCIYFLLPLIRLIGEEIGVALLSGTILKTLFAIILKFEILMRKSALENGMISQKSDWLASL